MAPYPLKYRQQQFDLVGYKRKSDKGWEVDVLGNILGTERRGMGLSIIIFNCIHARNF